MAEQETDPRDRKADVVASYQEAKKKSLTVRWKTQECGAKDCWCRMIVPETPLLYVDPATKDFPETYEEIDIASAGCLSKDIAEHIVEVHNRSLEK